MVITYQQPKLVAWIGTLLSLAFFTAPLGAADEQNLLGKDFKSIDSGLTDCSIPFEELRTRSPDCTTNPPSASKHVRCESYSLSQFPEVVSLKIIKGQQTFRCTGTLVTLDWVLTAAHCIAGLDSRNPGGNADVVLTESPELHVIVSAQNAVTIKNAEETRLADSMVVDGRYGGRSGTPPFHDDFALLHLSQPYPAHALEPAAIAPEKEVSQNVTIAGFGYSDLRGGSFGIFGVTWPEAVRRDDEVLRFDPSSSAAHSAFCQGDSGGPVFMGRSRGCPSSAGESRPHVIEATISWNRLGTAGHTDNPDNDAAEACRQATDMEMQIIATHDRRNWICRVTSNRVAGCETAHSP